MRWTVTPAPAMRGRPPRMSSERTMRDPMSVTVGMVAFPLPCMTPYPCGVGCLSCSSTVLVFQEPTEPFSTPERARTLCRLVRQSHEHHVTLALMRALCMVIDDVFRERVSERLFTEQDQSGQYFLFDR